MPSAVDTTGRRNIVAAHLASPSNKVDGSFSPVIKASVDAVARTKCGS